MTVAHALVTAAHGGILGRPGPEVPGIKGLYVVGERVVPEGMPAKEKFLCVLGERNGSSPPLLPNLLPYPLKLKQRSHKPQGGKRVWRNPPLREAPLLIEVQPLR